MLLALVSGDSKDTRCCIRALTYQGCDLGFRSGQLVSGPLSGLQQSRCTSASPVPQSAIAKLTFCPEQRGWDCRRCGPPVELVDLPYFLPPRSLPDQSLNPPIL